jgi:hypothetical protein
VPRTPLTFYASDPVRYCFCERYEFASKIGDSDWQVLIKTFKGEYSSGPSARSPKGEPLPMANGD